MAVSTAAPPVRTPVTDDLVNATVMVDGRRVSYASGGRGLPVLFLHGWGLDHEAYRRPLRRLTARGCRVIAPSLPAFGWSDELAVRQRTLAGYGAWVGRFLDAIGVDEPMLVLGHSFGGGIATRFAHDHPDRVRYLVLLNSVGDPRAFIPGGGRGDGWRASLTSLLNSWRLPEDMATSGLIQRTLLSNLQRHPIAVLQAAQAALSADLRAEMAALAERGLGVLVLWSDDDRVIPQAAFDTFCSTFGTDGHLVRGGHSWLLANPEVLGEVLDNVIHVEAGEHGARAATAGVSQLRALLADTTMPAAVATRLLDGVSPLWVMSEAPDVLAADLALCHPRVGAGEVRAVARAMPAPGSYRLTVVAHDRRGFLADTAAVLAAAGVTIESASAMTWPDRRLAMHALTVRRRGGIDDAGWNAIGARLTASIEEPTPATFMPRGQVRVTRTGSGLGTSIVRVTAPDNVGLLSAICRWFAEQGVSVQAAGIATVDGVASDVFLVDGECDTKRLAAHLSEPPPTPSCVRALRALLSVGTSRP